MANLFILKKPFITEKTAGMAVQGKYTFVVAGDTTKSEVKKAIEAEYKVHVTQVHVINTRPKERRRGRVMGVRPSFKKATVTLKKGEKLDILSQ
jgi:large subunit ribosomal protein L23